MSRFLAGDAHDRPLLAVGLLCGATLCFSIMAACAKWLTQELAVLEAMWGRYFFHALLIALVFPRRIPSLLTSGRRDLQVLRSILVLAATACAFTAFRSLPIATAAALTFVGPLLVVALAALALGERVAPRRWAAVAVGFLGVLVILRPGLGVMHWASLFALASGACYATYQILTRLIRGLAPPLTSLFYTALVGAVATSVVVPFFWVTPRPEQWAVMLALGLLGGVGHLGIIKAYESASASIVAPFAYSELIWATLVGWMVFSDLPDGWTMVGASILIATGIYLVRAPR